jgi:hypothetical protein
MTITPHNRQVRQRARRLDQIGQLEIEDHRLRAQPQPADSSQARAIVRIQQPMPLIRILAPERIGAEDVADASETIGCRFLMREEYLLDGIAEIEIGVRHDRRAHPRVNTAPGGLLRLTVGELGFPDRTKMLRAVRSIMRMVFDIDGGLDQMPVGDVSGQIIEEVDVVALRQGLHLKMMMAIDDPPRWIENLLGLVARFSGLPIGCIARPVHRHPFSPVGPTAASISNRR